MGETFLGVGMLRRWLLVALAMLPVLILAGEVGTQPPRVQAATDLNFTQTCPAGGELDFVVPMGATLMRVTLSGARGAPSGGARPGGSGATVAATFPVTEGSIYYLDLGCAGGVTTGGWNGGGNGGPGASTAASGGGAGASVLRTSPCATLPDPCASTASGALLVAGGGGGGGGDGGPDAGGFGGTGGIPNGGNGSPGGATGGGGATPGAPGTATAVNGTTPGDPGGIVGKGGTGGNVVAGSGAGGGGGGGCHGGGGGSTVSEGGAGGGGGGSSCAAAAAQSVTYALSPDTNGVAVVQFFVPPLLTKTFNPTSIVSGGISTLTFTLDNENPRPITNVSFTDNLGAVGIQVAPIPNFSQDCGVGTFSGFTAGSTLLTVTGVGLSDDGFIGEMCTIMVDVTSSVVGPHVNTIPSVSSAETGAGPGATATLTVTAPPTIDLIATKTSSASPQVNVPFTWTVHVANTGNSDAVFPFGAVVFSDNLPNANITYSPAVPVSNLVGISGTLACAIAAADVTCTGTGLPFSIAAGGAFDLTITATASAGGSFVNPRAGGVCQADPLNQVAEANGGNTAETNNGCSNTVTITDTTDLTIAFTSSPASLMQGQTGANYTIGVGNGIVATATAAPARVAQPSKATAGTVTVVVTLPAGVTATAISGAGWTCDLPTLTCTRSDSLADGALYPPINLTVNVASNAPASVTLTAVVSNPNEPIAARNNNTATVTTAVGAVGADLAVTKTAGATSVLAGSNVSFTITLRNNGPAAATNVVLTDPIPANTTFVSATGDPAFTIAQPAVGSGPPAAVTFSTATFANGATATFTITLRLSPTAPSGTLTNVATVTATSLDPVVANNSANAVALTGVPSPTPTATPTSTPAIVAPPVIPQVFQNPAIQGIFQPGNRATPTPQRPAAAPGAAVQPSNAPQQIFRPPSTGDAGLWGLPSVW